jgi:hypothetical protein
MLVCPDAAVLMHVHPTPFPVPFNRIQRCCVQNSFNPHGIIPNIFPLKCLLQFHEMAACKEYTSDGVLTTLRPCVQLPDF